MRTSRPGKSNHPRGFTLIELAVVLFIVSLILWTALPKISFVSSDSIEEFMRKMVLRIESTLEDALFQSQGGKITVKIADGTIEGYRYREEGELLKNWSLKLPDRFSITSVTTNFGKSYTTEDVDIPFSPMGYIPKTLIVVEEKEEPSSQTIRINPFTGKVEIIDGIVTEKM